VKISPEQQQQIEKDLAGKPCFFCDNTAQAVASIDVDPALFNGHEQLAFPVCLSCLDNAENWNTESLEMAALGKVYKHGWT